MIIHINPLGGMGNRMLQYMAALTLSDSLGGGRLSNVCLPEWGISVPEVMDDIPQAETIILHDVDAREFDLERMVSLVRGRRAQKVVLAGYLQNLAFLQAPEFYRQLFCGQKDVETPAPTEIIINVRAGEVLNGIPHYTLVPIRFLREIVDRAELKPVIIGQLEPSVYCDALVRSFPDARIVPSQGAMNDFEMIRRASHIIPAVSTFSWLAAWLSHAETIYMPLTGFFNPAQLRVTDLLPTGDSRYRFFLFPLNFGVLEMESVEVHERMAGMWKEISPRQVDVLRCQTPFLPAANVPSDIQFDEVWYCHQYLDAAMAISDGWFERPIDHYLEIGQRRGYQPIPPKGTPRHDAAIALPNVALGKPATQSSISEWSLGKTREEDASGAVNGQITGDYGFHTEREEHPWWQVDLGQTHQIAQVRVYNRLAVIQRASPLVIQVSNEGRDWRTVMRTRSTDVFGGADGKFLCWTPSADVLGRFVRLLIPRRECLHLDEVQVYGIACSSS